MQVVLRCQSTCPFCISNCMHTVPQSPAAANQKYSLAPLTPLLPQLSMHQSGSMTTLHAVHPHGPRLLTQDEEVLSSAGWLDFSASPRKESLAACTCTLLNRNHAAAMPRFSAQVYARIASALMTGNRHAARAPLTRAPHARGGSLAFSTIG